MATALLVNERQRGNPLLEHIRNVPWQYTKEIVPDYVMGAKACAVFISVRYHLLKPQYLARRLSELSRDWPLRVLLCHVDSADPSKPLHELNMAAVRHECTLILAHDPRECARMLECFKAYENNSASAIKEKVEEDHLARLSDALTTIKPLNRTDVATLARTFGSLRNILDASLEDLRDCPGLGDKKVKRLHDAFTAPFSLAARRRRDAKRRRQDDDAVALTDAARAATEAARAVDDAARAARETDEAELEAIERQEDA